MRFNYAQSKDGIVHLTSALNGEFTLCGDAYDGSVGDADADTSWVDRKTGPVTCPKCLLEIENCRSTLTAAVPPVPEWAAKEIRDTWRAAFRAKGEREAFGLLERMADRLGWGRLVNPSLVPPARPESDRSG